MAILAAHWWKIVVVLVLAGFAWDYFGNMNVEKVSTFRGDSVVPIVGQNAQRQVSESRVDTDAASGVIFGKRELTIKAKSQGEIYEFLRQEGEWVAEGAVIAVIDDRQEKIERSLANAEFKMAERDYQKTHRLGKYVSKDELQQKENVFLKKKSTLDLKEVDLANTRVISPISGFVTKTYFDKGETVSVGDKFAEIVQLDELVMFVNVPSKLMGKFKQGTEVQFKVPELSDQKFPAQLYYVSPVIDAASDTVRLKFSIKNPKDKDAYVLKPGMIGQLVL